MGGWRDWQARFDIVKQRTGHNNEHDSPCTEHHARGIPVESPVHDKGNANSRYSGTSPHDAECETLTCDEPLVEKNDGWRVEHGTTKGVEHTLGKNQMPDTARERRNNPMGPKSASPFSHTSRRGSGAFLLVCLSNKTASSTSIQYQKEAHTYRARVIMIRPRTEQWRR